MGVVRYDAPNRDLSAAHLVTRVRYTMKIWTVVQDEPYEGRDVISVHATEEHAKQALDQQKLLHPRIRFDIDEWEVEP